MPDCGLRKSLWPVIRACGRDREEAPFTVIGPEHVEKLVERLLAVAKELGSAS